MQKVKREDIEIDVCPTCKGVWLDRGELDKLLNSEREQAEHSLLSHRRFQEEIRSFGQDPDGWKRNHKYDEHRKRFRYDGDDEGDDHDSRKRKRRRGFDLFDIFD